MAAIDAIVNLGAEHVAAGFELSSEAGWNQTEDDWRLMIAHGHAIGVMDAGELIASALALPYGDISWISMVLVTPAHQRRGLAGRMIADCLGWLGKDNITAVLDATPAGSEVYRRLDFHTVRRMTRWQRRLPETGFTRLPLVLPQATLADIAALDRRAIGGDRRFLLADMLARPDRIALSDAGARAFALSRRGRIATQLGPITAETPRLALEMLDAALTRAGAPVFIDAFDDQAEFSNHLQSRGFVAQRSFERMARGARRDIGDPKLSFAAAGPELG